ncbi:hypothetical protein [Falsiruegeria mediterranea]|nr:hypothetical protein [Falsiruegeria mediterranea]
MAKDTSFLGLNRPEYIPSRELFMSELAWSLAPPHCASKLDEGGGTKGIVYSVRNVTKPGNRVDPFQTRPKMGDERFLEVASVLEQQLGIRKAEDRDVAVRCLLDDIEAPTSRNSARTTATPLMIEAALLQERRGVTGKDNPANIARIVEQMYALGGGSRSAASQWVGAVNGAGQGGIPAWAVEAIKVLLPTDLKDAPAAIVEKSTQSLKTGIRVPRWLEQYPSTPFHWFAESWGNLCSSGWIDAMPRRRWTDWASCIARTAIGAGFLFEMHLARRMVAGLVAERNPEKTVSIAMDEGNRLLAWDDRHGTSEADVGPTINRLVAEGSACLELLDRLAKPSVEDGVEKPPVIRPPCDFDDVENGLVEWLRAARGAIEESGQNIAQDVAEALEADISGGGKNLKETIRYSLLDRSENKKSDLYALLRGAGRFTVVEPGQEWLVAVASMCASKPGRIARMADLQKSLRALGMEVAQSTLVARLERFGLTRSSHDADEALEIRAGF